MASLSSLARLASRADFLGLLVFPGLLHLVILLVTALKRLWVPTLFYPFQDDVQDTVDDVLGRS